MIRHAIYRAVFVLLLPATSVTNAGDTATHNRFGRLLLESNPSDGGCSGLSEERVDAVSRWMDAPATMTGKQVDRSTQKILTPSNHPYQRHNPFQVAKAMSGKGAVYDEGFVARLNAARVHKVVDVAHNTVPVDGFGITPDMRSEAKAILGHIERHKKLPSRLPCWVDYRGVDGVTNPTKLADIKTINEDIFKTVRLNQIDDYVDTSFKGLRSLPRATQRKLVVAKLSGTSSRLIGRTMVLVAVAAVAYDGYRIYTDQATVLDIAEENVNNFLVLAEAVNYPRLLLEDSLIEVTGIEDVPNYLKYLKTTTTMPSPTAREYQESIAVIRRTIDEIRQNPTVQKSDAVLTKKTKEAIHSTVGTKRNLLRTYIESGGGTIGRPVSWFERVILDQILPRDELEQK